MAPHSSTLAWKIPWAEEPGRLQSMGSRGVGHDWVTWLSLSCIGEGSGNPLQCSCLENPRDGGAWWAAIYGVAQSQTPLKWLSSSSSSSSNISLVDNFLPSFTLQLWKCKMFAGNICCGIWALSGHKGNFLVDYLPLGVNDTGEWYPDFVLWIALRLVCLMSE